MGHDIYWKSLSGNTYMTVAGTIRNAGSGWYVIDDAGHSPSSLTINSVTTTNIRIDYPPALRVIDFAVGPDDTLARPPYKATFGGSVGLSYAFIYGTVSGVSFNPQTWSNSGANIWVHGTFLVEEA